LSHINYQCFYFSIRGASHLEFPFVDGKIAALGVESSLPFADIFNAQSTISLKKPPEHNQKILIEDYFDFNSSHSLKILRNFDLYSNWVSTNATIERDGASLYNYQTQRRSQIEQFLR
jgi:hypothetical protein